MRGEETNHFHLLSKMNEDQDNYYLEVDLPGIKKEAIKIEVIGDNILRIQGERKEEKADQQSHYSEVFYGSFSRDYPLPSVVKNQEIKAHYENGVLRVTIPKAGESKSRAILVE